MNALSPRESQVMRLIASGHTARDIAAKIGTGYETIRDQRKQAIRKLGARNTAHAVARFVSGAAA